MAAQLRVCRIPDCDQPSRSRLLCWSHYKRLLRYGDPLHHPQRGKPPSPRRLCALADCERVHVARDMCQMHYQRWLKRKELPPKPDPWRLLDAAIAADKQAGRW